MNIFILELILFVFICNGAKVYVPDEQRLYRDIMVGYENSVRPVLNSSTVVIVKFALKLNQIVGLDERHQVLTTNVFIDQTWVDENLIWDPEDYNNIRSIRIPTKFIWLPDTFIYNNADAGSTGFMQGSYVLIHHDGTIKWPIPFKLKSSCKVDITFFPFDDQICILRFGSWIYSGNWMDFTPQAEDEPIDLSSYMNNSEWDLLSISQQKNSRRHSCCPEKHPFLTFMLHIRRKTFYYIFNIIVPCSMLSILTLLTFWLPPTSGEKITLGLSVFLAFSMFMLLIAEEVPATSEAVPLIGVYLCVVMTMTSVSVIVAVLVINIYNRGMKTNRAPYWLRKLTLQWLSKAICLHHDIILVAQGVKLNIFTYTSMRTPDPLAAMEEKSVIESNEIKGHKNNNKDNYCSDTNFNSPSEVTLPPNQPEKVWYRHEELEELLRTEQERSQQAQLRQTQTANKGSGSTPSNATDDPENDNVSKRVQYSYSIESNLSDLPHVDRKKIMIAEWQRIAAATDRILFIIYMLATVTAYFILLIILPTQHYSSQKHSLSNAILLNNGTKS